MLNALKKIAGAFKIRMVSRDQLFCDNFFAKITLGIEFVLKLKSGGIN